MGETSLNSPDLRESEDRQVCVLVVEDDPALQRMILNYFRRTTSAPWWRPVARRWSINLAAPR